MKRVALLAAAACAALAVAGQAPAATKLSAVVGPGFTISLASGGKKVSALKAGAYTLVVDDKSSIHNFRLTGPGVAKATSITSTGKQTWKLTLKKGTYTYVCDPHASAMRGTFEVA